MSVSLALIPVALALRVVMGKENFENWVDSMQVKVPTNFKSELELARTVRKAGYDAEKWAGSIKTHIDGERLFFFWQVIDGKWHAVYGKTDSQSLIQQFQQAVEKSAGRKIFLQTVESAIQTETHHTTNRVRETHHTQANNRIPETISVPDIPKKQSFPTNFRDEAILFRTLQEFGVNPVLHGNGEINCTIEGIQLRFVQEGEEPFRVEVSKVPNLGELFQYLTDLDEDYKRCVQSIVYERLMQRVEAKKMEVEQEEVLEDNSILITLNIRG